MKIVFSFDMDDTLVNTRKEIYNLAMQYCLMNDLNNYFVELTDKLKAGEPVSALSLDIKELIDKEVIAKRTYLSTAEPSEICNQELKNTLGALRNELEGVKIVICSHRGNNKEAFMSTYRWLEDNNILDYFDMIHSIDNTVHKDKIKFLKGTYPEHEVILVDDNPYSDDKNSVLIYDKINRYKKYEEFLTYTDSSDIFKLLRSKINNYK